MTQAVERKFQELENVILDLSTKDRQSHGGESDVVIELLKNRILALEVHLIDEDAIINFLLQKSITSKSPERKFGNEQIDSSKEDERANRLE